jgi:hypothetical protein
VVAAELKITTAGAPTGRWLDAAFALCGIVWPLGYRHRNRRGSCTGMLSSQRSAEPLQTRSNFIRTTKFMEQAADALSPEWVGLLPCHSLNCRDSRIGASTDQNYMKKRIPQAPELKALLAQLQASMSPRKRLQVRAAAVTAEVIAQVQRQSRLKK